MASTSCSTLRSKKTSSPSRSRGDPDSDVHTERPIPVRPVQRSGIEPLQGQQREAHRAEAIRRPSSSYRCADLERSNPAPPSAGHPPRLRRRATQRGRVPAGVPIGAIDGRSGSVTNGGPGLPRLLYPVDITHRSRGNPGASRAPNQLELRTSHRSSQREVAIKFSVFAALPSKGRHQHKIAPRVQSGTLR